jgi:nucleoside phosphorylase
MATPQQFGSASSYAKKYALGNLLLIDDTADADATNDHGATRKPKITSNNIEKAKKFLSNGGLLKTLEDKYDIEPTALKELQNG